MSALAHLSGGLELILLLESTLDGSFLLSHSRNKNMLDVYKITDDVVMRNRYIDNNDNVILQKMDDDYTLIVRYSPLPSTFLSTEFHLTLF